MRLYPFVLLAMMFLVASCSSIEKKDANFRVVETDAVKYAEMNLKDIANANEQSIKKGEEDGLNFFAPETFKQAIYYRDKVNKTIQKGQSRAEIIRESELVKKYLNESYALKETLSLELKDILEVNDFLRKLNANQTYKKDYDAFQKRIADLIEKYEEKRNPDALKDRNLLLADMQKIEAQATIDIILAPARNILADMKEKSLDKAAPSSLIQAQDIYSSSEAAIRKDCRNQENLTKVGTKSLFWAKRARNISEETLRLKELKKDDFEAVVLDAEKRLYSIDLALGTEDFRDRSLNDHAAALVKEAKKRPTADASAAPPEKKPVEPVKKDTPKIQELAPAPPAPPAPPAQPVQPVEQVQQVQQVQPEASPVEKTTLGEAVNAGK
jgi:hypothetical protein